LFRMDDVLLYPTNIEQAAASKAAQTIENRVGQDHSHVAHGQHDVPIRMCAWNLISSMTGSHTANDDRQLFRYRTAKTRQDQRAENGEILPNPFRHGLTRPSNN